MKKLNRVYRYFTLLLLLVGFSIVTVSTTRQSQAANVALYGDTLDGEWQNWSWGTSLDFSNRSPKKDGSHSLRVQYDSAWVALYLNSQVTHNAIDYRALGFWAHGGTGGQLVNVVAIDADGTWHAPHQISLQANSWTYFELSIAQLGNPATIAGLAWQDGSGSAQAAFYLDEIMLLETVLDDENETTHQLNVNPAVEIRPISPNIYGMSFADAQMVAALDLPLNRWGGNAVTRYSFDQDSSNRASDYYFENIPNEVNGTLPANSALNNFIVQNDKHNAETLTTLPMIGWTPKDRTISCGFSVAKYGQQDSVDPWRNDCGNGLRNGQPITGNDPTDTSIAITPADVQAWMADLEAQHNGAVTLFSLDNEPMLWHETHRDVHPNPVSYDEIRDLTYTYASAFKAQQPSAELLGPGVWGWTAYDYSAVDAASGQWTNPPDRNAHGDTPFIEWYLQEMARYEQQNGIRILDYVDVHYYPQQQGVTLQPAGDYTTQQLRMNATRALWDATYIDESWINEPVQLIPRMQDWVAQNYPSTKTAITEYNFGGVEHINGAVAQAEVLGIFGREGVDLAVMWDPPSMSEPTFHAFGIYRNYDGTGGKFGEMSVETSSSDPLELSVFAARRQSDNALTLVVVNKTFDNIKADLTVAGVGSTSAERYQYSSHDLTLIEQLGDASFSADNANLTFPSQSFTMLVLTDDAPPTPEPTTSTTSTPTASPTNTPLPTATPVTPVTSPTETPHPPTNTPVPPSLTNTTIGETTQNGYITAGSFTSTWVNDNNVESLTERVTGGKPSKRRSLLEHQWSFTPNAAPAHLIANAWYGDNQDGDQFIFSYSTDGTTFTDAFIVESSTDTIHQIPVPVGVIAVRVQDTDRTQGNSTTDTLHVDYLAIVADGAPTPTPEPTISPTVSPTMTPTPNPVDYAISEQTTLGVIVSGSLQDTQSADNALENLRETESGGNKRQRYSHLEHHWTFNVSGGAVSTLVMDAWATDQDADQFVVSYSTDGNTFIDMFTLSDTAARNTFVLPSGTVGNLIVRVQDSDRTRRQRDLGNVFIDYLAVINEPVVTRTTSNIQTAMIMIPNQLQVSNGSVIDVPVWFAGSAESVSFSLDYDSLWLIASEGEAVIKSLQENVALTYQLDAPNGNLNVTATGALQNGLLMRLRLDVRDVTPSNHVLDLVVVSGSAETQSGSLYVLENVTQTSVPTNITLTNNVTAPSNRWVVLGVLTALTVVSGGILRRQRPV